MKLCVSLYSLHPYITSGEMDVAGALEFLHSEGVEYVELLDLYLPTPQLRAEARELLDRYSMKAGAYAASNEFAAVAPEALEGEISRLKQAIRIAAEFETRTVRVFAGNRSAEADRSFDQALAQIIDSLKQCTAAALENGVTLCLENHGLLAGKSGQVRAILDGVGSPALQATADTGNFLIADEAPLAAVRALSGCIGHVHFKDMKQVAAGGFAAPGGRRYLGTALGEGEVPLGSIVELLKESGYDGCVSIEYEAPQKDGCREALTRSIRSTRSLLGLK